jgi:hypothetical protein
LAQSPNLPRELQSTRVVVRFCLRIAVLLVFASFGSIGFARGFATLLWMSVILGAAMGILRREPPFDTVLNHWDETAAYAALCCLMNAIG